MQHDHLEFWRSHTETFSVVGPASFIAKSLGWFQHAGDIEPALAAQLNSGSDVDVGYGAGSKTGVLISWSAAASAISPEPVYTVKFWPVNKKALKARRDFIAEMRRDPAIAAYPTPDPWIKVGTMTIDGTWSQVDAMLCSSNLVDDDVFLLGGRHIRPREHIAESYAARVGDVKVVVCDIVRRQSEIDAELQRGLDLAGHLAEVAEREAQRPIDDCPECGPHGNVGRVLGADIWYPCTLCAGGRPGDMHEVQHEVINIVPPRAAFVISAETGAAEAALSAALIADGASSEVAMAGTRAFLKVLAGPTDYGAGTTIDDLAGVAAAALRHLFGPPPEMSIEQYRALIFGEIPKP